MSNPGETRVGSVECLDEAAQRYRVQGRSGSYVVEASPESPSGWCCDCPHYRYRCRGSVRLCWHIEAVVTFREQQDACPVCHGRAFLIPSPLCHYVTREGERDTLPAACVECKGTGKRSHEAKR